MTMFFVLFTVLVSMCNSQSSTTTLAPPIYAGDCPFFKSTATATLVSPESDFHLVAREINSSDTFKNTMYYNQESIHGRVVNVTVQNVTVGAKGSCLSCLDNSCDRCSVDLQVGSGSSGISIPGPLTRMVLPLYVYEVEMHCVLKDSKIDLKREDLPRGNIKIGSTCEFTHVRPGEDYVFVGSIQTKDFKFRIKYAYQATSERVEVLRQLCGFRSPVLSPSINNGSVCATYESSKEGEKCVTVGSATSNVSGLGYLLVLMFFALVF